MTLSQMQAKIAALESRVRSLSGIQIEGYNRATGGGITFTKAQREVSGVYVPPKPVIVVVKPIEAHVELTVQAVKYIDLPFKPCTKDGETITCYIERTGASFQAMPDFGKRAIDYEGDYVPDADVLDGDTPYLDAQYIAQTWVVRKRPEAGGAIRFVKIQSAVAGARTVSVQELKRKPRDGFGRHYANVGEPFNVALWGDQTGDDFLTLINPADVSANTRIVPLVTVAGEPYLIQYLWWYVGIPAGTLPLGGCRIPAV